MNFPADYPAANLAGRAAEFAITVHRVEEQRLPELDDAFATSFGLAGGAALLRSEVRNNMARELAERVRSESKTHAFDALIKANDVAVPRALVEEEITTLQADAMRQMGSKDPKQAPPRERFAALARRRVAIGLLIQELLKQHKIKLDQARVEQRLTGAGGAVRETRRGRAVLPQQPWHDGADRGGRARGSGRGLSARARQPHAEGSELQGIHGRLTDGADGANQWIPKR